MGYRFAYRAHCRFACGNDLRVGIVGAGDARGGKTASARGFNTVRRGFVYRILLVCGVHNRAMRACGVRLGGLFDPSAGKKACNLAKLTDIFLKSVIFAMVISKTILYNVIAK